MITDGEKQHYLAVKGFSGLCRGITTNHNGDFYCMGCLHSFRTGNTFKKCARLCSNHDYCPVKMPEKGKNIL